MAIGIRRKKIINASWIAIIANALLSVLKIVVGIIAGSFAVIADGIDSASDVLTSLITLFYCSYNKPTSRYKICVWIQQG